jgi:hypothetical protein
VACPRSRFQLPQGFIVRIRVKLIAHFRPPIDMLNHRLAKNERQRFTRKARGSHPGRNDGNNTGHIKNNFASRMPNEIQAADLRRLNADQDRSGATVSPTQTPHYRNTVAPLPVCVYLREFEATGFGSAAGCQGRQSLRSCSELICVYPQELKRLGSAVAHLRLSIFPTYRRAAGRVLSPMVRSRQSRRGF